MPFSRETKTRALVACGRHCCLCHTYCGNNIEVHHIRPQADGGDDSYDNAIPLCFKCHAEVGQYNPNHPKGTKFSEEELKLHRDNWYSHVKNFNAEKPNGDSVLCEPKIYRQKGYKGLVLKRVTTGTELLQYVQGRYGCEYSNDEAKTNDEVELLQGFVEWLDCLLELDEFSHPGESISYAYQMTEELEKLNEAGFWVFCAIEHRVLVASDGKKSDYPIAITRIVRTNNPEIVPMSSSENGSKHNS